MTEGNDPKMNIQTIPAKTMLGEKKARGEVLYFVKKINTKGCNTKNGGANFQIIIE